MCKDGQELRGLSPIKRQRLLKKDREVPGAVCGLPDGPRSRYVFGRYARGARRESSPRRPRALSAGEDNLSRSEKFGRRGTDDELSETSYCHPAGVNPV